MSVRLSCAVAGLLIAGAVIPSAPPEPADSPVPTLIRDLGSDDFRVRERASRELRRCPDAARELRRATTSADPEIASRAAAILESFAERFREDAVRRLQNAVKRRDLDLAAEIISQFPAELGREPGELWQGMLDLGWKARHRDADDTLPRREDGMVPERTYKQMAAGGRFVVADPATTHRVENTAYCYRTTSDVTVPASSRYRLIVTTGRIEAIRPNLSYMLSCGRLAITPKAEGAGAINDFVLMSGSDVETVDKLGRCAMFGAVIVAAGDVRCQVRAINSVILTGGDVYLPEKPDNHCTSTIIRAGGKIHNAADKRWLAKLGCDFQENVADPTAPFTFFSLARVGLTVAAGEGGVRVAKIDAKSPFAAAGVAAGDVIVAVDDAKVGTPDDLKKRVRAGVARGDAEVRVRTGATARDLLVRFPE